MVRSPMSVIEALLGMDVHKRRQEGGGAALDIAIFEGNHEAVALLQSHGVTRDERISILKNHYTGP